MNLSMTSGAREVKANPSQHAGKVGVSLAKGLLMGLVVTLELFYLSCSVVSRNPLNKKKN